MKCISCGTENGVTMYFNKKCKKCGRILTEQDIKLIKNLASKYSKGREVEE